jgi:hypothetical protein
VPVVCAQDHAYWPTRDSADAEFIQLVAETTLIHQCCPRPPFPAIYSFCSRLEERIVTGDLAERAPRSFAFGPFVLFPERQLLLKDEAPVRIGGRALDILTALVERPGELVN